MKRFSLYFLAILLFFSMGVTCIASSMPYVGNKSTKVYHISECTYAGKISSKNRIYFNSRSKAEAMGYRRCYYCGDGVVKPGHSGGGGSGSSSNSGHSNSGSSNNQTLTPTIATPEHDSNETENYVHPLFWIAVLAGFAWIIVTLVQIKITSGKQDQAPPEEFIKQKSSTDDFANRPISSPTAVWINLDSSFIARAEYSERGLFLKFTSGYAYLYYNAPKAVYDELVASPSPGRYFHQKIKDMYPFTIYRQ